MNCTPIAGQYGVLKTNGVLCYAKGDTLDEALEDAIHSAYDWISLELTEEEPDFPPVSDVADLGKSEGEIARNIAVNIRLFEGWDE